MSRTMKRGRGKGYVFFTDNTDLWWLRWLKSGFRHCCLVICREDSLILVDPLSHQLVLDVCVAVDEASFRRWLTSCGMVYVAVEVRDSAQRVAPLGLLTCVEVIKRILGIRRRRLITPWQLYRFLIDMADKKEYIPNECRRDDRLGNENMLATGLKRLCSPFFYEIFRRLEMGGFVRKRILGIRPTSVVASVPAAPSVSVEDEVAREREERVRSVEQRRKSRGFESLVRTTLSGIIDDGSLPFVRKRLLGE